MDIEPVVASNYEAKKDAPDNWRRPLNHYASIPWHIIHNELVPRGIMTAAGAIVDEKALRKWLSDSSGSLYRVRGGRVG